MDRPLWVAGGVSLAAILVAVVVAMTRPSPTTQAAGGLVTNPTHVAFTSLDHDTVARYEVDVIDEATASVLQTLAIPHAATTIRDGLVEAPITVYPLEPRRYHVVVRAVAETAAATSAQSPAGSRVPPLASLHDATDGVWTFAPGDTLVLRNGATTGGRGTELLIWDAPSAGSIYTLGTDGQYWHYRGGESWVGVGADPSGGASPVPTAGASGAYGRSTTSGPSNTFTRAPIAVF